MRIKCPICEPAKCAASRAGIRDRSRANERRLGIQVRPASLPLAENWVSALS
jgi:hypothetical protein